MRLLCPEHFGSTYMASHGLGSSSLNDKYHLIFAPIKVLQVRNAFCLYVTYIRCKAKDKKGILLSMINPDSFHGNDCDSLSVQWSNY